MTSSTVAVIALVFLLVLVLGGVILWLLGRRRGAIQPGISSHEKTRTGLSFSLSYLILPGALALVTITALAILYGSLPPEVAYRFTSTGAPRGYIGRELFVGLMVGAQLVVIAAAALVMVVVMQVARHMLKDNPVQMNPQRIIWLMVNMLVLPQLIVAFVALDAAYYASAQSHVMTPWAFSLIAIGVGTIVIIFLFARSVSGTRES